MNGLQMYHEIHGAGGTPLLLLHEGRTGDIDRPLTSTDLASDVVGLLQHQDIAQADVLGFSVGGAVALHLAIRHPELVRKLVVSGWSDADIQGIAAPTLITVGDLIAWGAGFVAAGDLGGGDVLLEVRRAVRALPRRPGAPPPLDLLLDGLASLTTDGHAGATPALQRAAKALAGIPVEDVLRWGWMATAASNAVWTTTARSRSPRGRSS